MTTAQGWRARDGLIGVLILAAVVLLYRFAGPMLRPEAAEEEAEVATDVAVHVAQISRATLHRWVTAYGRIEPEPPGQDRPPASVQIGSPVGGLLVGIECVEGRSVKAGDTLFRLDSRAAEATLQTARQALTYADQTYARQQALLKVDGTSQRAVLDAEAARDAARNAVTEAETQLALLRITAPTAGTVVRIDARLGQSVEANSILAEIVDLSRLVVSAEVPSPEARGLRVGMTVEVEGASGPAGKGTGRLIFVGDRVDPRSDTVGVRVSIPGSHRPGEFLTLRVMAEQHDDRLVVPEASLVTSADEGAWIVLVEGDQAKRVPVTSGLHEGGLVEVSGEGLREGLTVVTDDAYSLPAETKVHIVGR